MQLDANHGDVEQTFCVPSAGQRGPADGIGLMTEILAG